MKISKRWYSPRARKHEFVEVSHFVSCSFVPVSSEPIHIHMDQECTTGSNLQMRMELSKASARKLAELLTKYANELDARGQ
jgi:hypothetical protein